MTGGAKRRSGRRVEPLTAPGRARSAAEASARRGPRPLALAAGAGAVVVAGVAVVAVARSGSDGEGSAAAGSTATTAIERRDLVETQTEDGTLGYADSRTVVNRMSGTVTWLPRAGTVVRTNRRLYAVDGKAVYLLDGSSPAYRALAPGITGKDVAALERNLRALGKDPGRAMAVDGTWDGGTTAAVKRWQHDKALEETGTIELGRVVFAPGDRRVSSLELKVGASAGSGGGGGSNQPAAYDGADPSSGAMRLVAYEASAEGTTTTPPATTTTPATTTPRPRRPRRRPPRLPPRPRGTRRRSSPRRRGAGTIRAPGPPRRPRPRPAAAARTPAPGPTTARTRTRARRPSRRTS